MSLVDFAAGLAIGLVIGHRRTHAALSAMREHARARLRAARDREWLMEQIASGHHTPTPAERREYEAWVDAGGGGHERG